jgi:hypothetical protein
VSSRTIDRALVNRPETVDPIVALLDRLVKFARKTCALKIGDSAWKRFELGFVLGRRQTDTMVNDLPG